MVKVLAGDPQPRPAGLEVFKVFVNALATRKELWNGTVARADLEDRLRSALRCAFEAPVDVKCVRAAYRRAWVDFFHCYQSMCGSAARLHEGCRL